MSDEIILPPPAPTIVPTAPEPAGFWARSAAIFIDLGVLFPVMFVLIRAERAVGFPLRGRLGANLLLSAAYVVLMIGAYGQTLGKMAAGVQVVGADGSRIGYGRSLGRFCATYLSAVILDIGFLIAAFTDNNRALHDYIAGTRVIYLPGVGSGRRIAMTVLGILHPLSVGAFGAYVGWKVFVPLTENIIAAQAEARGNYDAAAAIHSKQIARNPASADAWNGRCWDRALGGVALEQALDDCERSLKLKVQPATLDSRGMVYLKMRRFDESFASYDAAVRMAPSMSSPLYGRGLARRGKGDAAGSETDLEAAARLDPGIVETYRRYGFDRSAN